MKKCVFLSFFFKNIWSIQKKAVPLHAFSSEEYQRGLIPREVKLVLPTEKRSMTRSVKQA